MDTKNSLSRRNFLLAAAGGAAATLMLEGAGLSGPRAQAQGTPAPAAARATSGLLKGFIVSDAHLGWKSEKQPTPQAQAEMMRRICKNFPDLDVMIDTGDAHHNYATLADLGDWTDVIAGECGTLPLYYVAGNHEIGHCNQSDRELRSNRLGSVSCRPYYSFDLKGIHFISLPEQMAANLVTEEALAWAELDLAVNADKTTIVLSHNSIANTTLPHGDRSYRQLANSERVFNFLNRYPHVVGWMHGHNHTWEIVQRHGKFYVSNGRIGGFYPEEDYGGNRLGGIYFEVGPEQVTVRGWSATDEKFFDEMAPAYAHLKQTIQVPTSLDLKAAPAVSYGAGGAKDGERLIFVEHHAGAAQRELFLGGVFDKVINENSAIAYYDQRPEGGIMMPAVSVIAGRRKNKEGWEWMHPGLRLFPTKRAEEEVTVTIPEGGEARNAYYRCVPGKTYHGLLDLRSFEGGQQLKLRAEVYDSNQTLVASLDGPEWTLRQGYQILEADFAVPALRERASIYTSGENDTLYQILLIATITNQTNTIELRRFELTHAGAGEVTVAPAVTIAGRRYAAEAGALPHTRFVKFTLPDAPAQARDFAACEAKGNGRVSWLVRQTGVAWQVRNAPVVQRGGWLEVGALRNTFSPRQEVVIVPVVAVATPYVHRLRRVEGARIKQAGGLLGGSAIQLEIKKLLAPTAEVDVVMAKRPSRVSGADKWEHKDGRLTLVVSKPGRIEIA